MNMLQNFMDRLRSIVGLNSWDYCVLWKLSEDQRFLEWMDCCCDGIENIENGGKELLFPVSSAIPCRDVLFQHPRIETCDLLGQLPSSLPLDSGIHAEALISNQPRWLNFSKNTDSCALEETVGTRVLIPIPGGLVELFVAKQVSEDQQLIDFVTAQCNMSFEHQAMINSSNVDSNFSVDINAINNENQHKPFLADEDNYQNNPTIPFSPAIFSPATALENLNQLSNSPTNFFQQFSYNSENRTKNDMFFEGRNDDFPFKSSTENGFQEIDDELKKAMMSNTGVIEQQGNEKDSVLKQETGRSESISDCSDQNDDEEDAKYRKRTGKGPQSKNLVAERKRRKKLNDRLYSLRALVPKISKLDRASILGDAIEFVKELQKQVKDLQNELEEQSDDDEGANNNGTTNNGRSELLKQNGFHVGPKSEHEKSATGFHVGVGPPGNGVTDSDKQNHETEITNDKAPQMEPQVEVAQLDGNKFFVKVFCEHKAGGFVRLMEALNSMGLEVTNVNVTSCKSLVSNVFNVEKRDSEMVQADYVRDSLLEITRNPTVGWTEMVRVSDKDNNNMDYHHHTHHHHLHSGQQLASSQHHHHLHQLHN